MSFKVGDKKRVTVRKIIEEGERERGGERGGGAIKSTSERELIDQSSSGKCRFKRESDIIALNRDTRQYSSVASDLMIPF